MNPETDTEINLGRLTDKVLVDAFLHQLDIRGYNFFVLKGIRSLLNQKKVARCPKCGEEVRSDDDAICGRCL